jgi:predicted DCC family thiol-disulfide oxidoreductase YuxK
MAASFPTPAQPHGDAPEPFIERMLHRYLTRRAIVFLSLAFFALLGLMQPVFIGWAFDRGVGLHPGTMLRAALFSVSFWAVLAVTYLLFERFTPALGKRTGYVRHILRRETPIALSMARILITISLTLVSLKYVGMIYNEGIINDPETVRLLTLHQKWADRLIPFIDMGRTPWTVLVLAAAAAAVIGIRSRVSFLVAWLIPWYLVSHYEAQIAHWSHGEAPILLAGIPFLLRDLRGRLFWSPGERSPTRSPYAPIFFAQVLLALFYLGAFYAKMIYGSYAWVTSHHLANSLDIVWSGLHSDLVKPEYVKLFQTNPVLHFLAAYGHLLMQAFPILVLLSADKPFSRLFEGVVFMFGVFLLFAFMGHLWPWYWWMLIATVFIDWDWFLTRTVVEEGDATILSGRTWYGVLPAYCLLYFGMFVSQIIPDKLEAFPFFDKLNFYSVPFDVYPYEARERTHYFSYTGVGDFNPACGFNGDCIVRARRTPSNKNSASHRSWLTANGVKSLGILERCAQTPENFCTWKGADNRDHRRQRAEDLHRGLQRRTHARGEARGAASWRQPLPVRRRQRHRHRPGGPVVGGQDRYPSRPVDSRRRARRRSSCDVQCLLSGRGRPSKKRHQGAHAAEGRVSMVRLAAEREALAQAIEAPNAILFDGDCVYCNNFTQLMAARSRLGSLKVINLRDRQDLVAAMRAADMEPNSGMLFKQGGELYYGARAVNMLALASDDRGVFGKLTKTVFRHPQLTKLLYPAMRAGRSLTLLARGRKEIA